VPFFEELVSAPTGRRLVTKSLPSRDNPYIADLGRKDRKFTINGHVIGDDYIEQIRALQAASEVEGPGEYVNTYMGRKMVSCDDFAPTLVDSETRVAKFTFTFVEYSESDNKPIRITDTKATVVVAAEDLQSTTESEFVENYNFSNKPQFLVAKALSDCRDITGKIQDKLFFMNSVDTFASVLSSVESELASLLTDPKELATRLLLLLTTNNNETAGVGQIDDLLELFESLEIELTGTVNNDHINTFLKVAITGVIVTTMLNTNFTTYDDAILYSDKITTAIESIEAVVSDNLYEALYKLKSSVNDYVATTFIDYPRVSTVQLDEPTPAMVLSYQLYGNIDMADEILKRNKILHPGFVPAGYPIMVVSNE
jgi:prophage DNA circulation protein